MDQPDEEPTEKPTHTTEEAEAEGARMARNWLAIAVVSIFSMLLLAVVMMQWTGLINLGAPLADAEATQWLLFAVLALVVAALGVWSWRSVV